MKLVTTGKKFAGSIGLLAIGITAIGGAICNMRNRHQSDNDDYELDEAGDDVEDEEEDPSEESAVDDAE